MKRQARWSTVPFAFDANSVAAWVFTAPRDCTVFIASADYTHVGGSGAKLRLRKVTDNSSAPDATAGAAVIELIGTGFDLTATANVRQDAALIGGAACNLRKGEKIGAAFDGTLTALAGGKVTLGIRPRQQ